MDKKDLLCDEGKFSTFTRNNEAFSQTLLSLKNEFLNTGKCIENMNASDLNIMKSFTQNRKKSKHELDLKPDSSKHRSISTKRVSRTERRDGIRGKSKPKTILPEEIGMQEESEGFLAYSDLFKKYTKLKRHYRKERK